MGHIAHFESKHGVKDSRLDWLQRSRDRSRCCLQSQLNSLGQHVQHRLHSHDDSLNVVLDQSSGQVQDQYPIEDCVFDFIHWYNDQTMHILDGHLDADSLWHFPYCLYSSNIHKLPIPYRKHLVP